MGTQNFLYGPLVFFVVVKFTQTYGAQIIDSEVLGRNFWKPLVQTSSQNTTN